MQTIGYLVYALCIRRALRELPDDDVLSVALRPAVRFVVATATTVGPSAAVYAAQSRHGGGYAARAALVATVAALTYAHVEAYVSLPTWAASLPTQC